MFEAIVRWSPTRLFWTLALSYLAFAEAAGWMLSRVPPCIVEAAKYGADYQNNDCPAPHVVLIVAVTSLLETLGHDWLIAISAFVTALFTGTLWRSTHLLWKAGERHSERELRAYVFVKETFIRSLDGPDKPIIHIFFKNFGQTPASKFKMVGAVKFGRFPITEFSRDPSGDQRIAIVTILPGGELAHIVDLPFVITEAIKDELKAGRTAIYAFGDFEYFDAFKKCRTGTFRVIFGGDAGTRMFERDGHRLGAMAPTSEGNTTSEE